MSLKILYEINSLVTKKQASLLPYSIENEDFEGGLKYQRLIEGLTRQNWNNDDEARFDLYGDSVGGKTFEMLKSRAKEKLLSLLFLSDTTKLFSTSNERSYFNCCRSFLSAVILMNKSKFTSGHDQLKSALKNAREYQFHELEILVLGQLRKFYSFSGAIKNYQKCSSELNNVQALFSLEMEAENLDLELQMHLVRAVDLTDEWKKLLEKNYHRMVEILNERKSNAIMVSYFRIAIRYFQAQDDYHKAIELCEDLQKYLKSNPRFYIVARMGRAALNKLYCALYLRDYNAGEKFATECEHYMEPGTINWLVFKENHILLCLHTSKFEKARAIFEQVINDPVFDQYSGPKFEKWRIFEAYLEYAKPSDGAGEKRRFNVSKFLNEVPVFSKDKSGYNMSIIIAQILLSVKMQDWSRVIDRAEPLKTYLSRYVKKDRNPRSYYFLKLLEVMIRYEFHPEKTEQIGEKFFQKLQQSGASVPESSEIIPYEWLWKDLLAQLKGHPSHMNSKGVLA